MTKVVFTLVHGTFAKGADWVVHENSENDETTTFRTALRKSLPDHEVEFDDGFVWGHDKWTRFLDNTESTRSRAIDKLKEHLRSRTGRSSAFHFVVAHSHGGNVALQAMNDETVRESTTGVVCLATPFLFARDRQIPVRLLIWCVVALGILGAVLYENPTYLSAGLRYALIALIAFYTLVLVVLLPPFRGKDAPAQNYRSVEEMDGKLMVIRPSGDEASGLLRTNQFITWCLRRILSVLDWLIGILVSVALTLAFLRDLTHSESEWPGKAWAISLQSYVDRVDLDPIFGVLFVAVSAIVVLMAAQWLAVSFDHLGWFAKVEMLAEEAPPGMTSQSVILEPAQREGEQNLVHTDIYNRPQTIAAIAKWVTEKAPPDRAKASRSVEAVGV